MDQGLNEFMQAVTALAEVKGVAAFVVVAVMPSEDSFKVSAGAATRLKADDAETDAVMESMIETAKGALRKLKTEDPPPTYLN